MLTFLTKHRTLSILVISLLVSAFFLLLLPRLGSIEKFYRWKIYDFLQAMELKFLPPPPCIKDIVLVTIDNETIKSLDEKWPYSRSTFAKAIQNLKKAQPRVLAFDFIFYGRTQKGSNEDDLYLQTVLRDGKKVIFGAPMDEEGNIDVTPDHAVQGNISYGIVSKLQDFDGVVRRSLTYLVNEKNNGTCYLSFEMQILKAVSDMAISVTKKRKDLLWVLNEDGKKWSIPVDPNTQSFLINFRANTASFKRISFRKVLRGDFDPAAVKDKIVLVGLLSSLLGDFHSTSAGWIPGMTLVANAFLTLYSRNFLKELPPAAEIPIFLIGIILASLLVAGSRSKKTFLIVLIEISTLLLTSFFLFVNGYVWNYFALSVSVLLAPFIAKRIYIRLFHYLGRKKNLFTHS